MIMGYRRQIAMLESSFKRQEQRLHAENECLEKEYQAKITRIQVCNFHVLHLNAQKNIVIIDNEIIAMNSFGNCMLPLSSAYFILPHAFYKHL
jgi:hypothetical protein